MVYLKIKEVKNNIAEYYYQPEGKGEWGILSYDNTKNDLQIIKLAESDAANFHFYTRHCKSAMQGFFEKNNFPDKKMLAWY